MTQLPKTFDRQVMVRMMAARCRLNVAVFDLFEHLSISEDGSRAFWRRCEAPDSRLDDLRLEYLRGLEDDVHEDQDRLRRALVREMREVPRGR